MSTLTVVFNGVVQQGFLTFSKYRSNSYQCQLEDGELGEMKDEDLDTGTIPISEDVFRSFMECAFPTACFLEVGRVELAVVITHKWSPKGKTKGGLLDFEFRLKNKVQCRRNHS